MPDSRRIHTYCIGPPRSGTHSIAHLFGDHYRVVHEARSDITIPAVMGFAAKKISTTEFLVWLHRRDQSLNLELESAHYLHHVAPVLAEEFPRCRFLITVRDPVSWLQSEMVMNLHTANQPLWRQLERFRYLRFGQQFAPEDQLLGRFPNLYPVQNYLQYWQHHYQSLMHNLPMDRCLFLHTHRLKQECKAMARFLHIPLNTLNPNNSHITARPPDQQFDLFKLVDQHYVTTLAEHYCRQTLDQLALLIN